LAMVCSDLVLHGAKMQTGLLRALGVYAAIGSGTLLYLQLAGGAGAVAFAIYWAGAFLSWFGVRSHLESSILLRMLALLQSGSKTKGELIDEYERSYGEVQRVEELLRAGLVACGPEAIEVTPKGRLIVRAAAWLQ